MGEIQSLGIEMLSTPDTERHHKPLVYELCTSLELQKPAVRCGGKSYISVEFFFTKTQAILLHFIFFNKLGHFVLLKI